MKTSEFNLTKAQIKTIKKNGYDPRPEGFRLRIFKEDTDAEVMFDIAGIPIERDTESMELFIIGVCEAKHRGDNK